MARVRLLKPPPSCEPFFVIGQIFAIYVSNLYKSQFEHGIIDNKLIKIFEYVCRFIIPNHHFDFLSCGP